jgi:hypothetical protein
MAIDYLSIRAKAEAEIKANGVLVEFRKKPTTLLDPTKPWNGYEEANKKTEAYAIFTDYEIREIDGKSVMQGDKKVIVGASVFPNGIKDFLQIIDSENAWQIIDFKTVKPANLAIIYKVQVRE